MIEAEGLVKEFDGRTVLRGIDISVREGEVFGFLGPNGSGKTTTMRILLGLLRPTRGTARVMGEDLWENDAQRARVGVLLERDGLYEGMSVEDNLSYYARLHSVPQRERRVERMLDAVGLREHRGMRVGKLSRGMKRRAALARALVHDPEVLFLDEPLAGLDPEAQMMFREIIVSHAPSTTVLLNSHNLDEVQRMCGRVAIIHQGRIRATDSVSSLREGRPSLDLRFSTPGDRESAIPLIEASAHVIGHLRREEGLRVSLIGPAAPLISELVSAGVGIEEASRPSRSLEDVYLDIVREVG